MTLDRTELQNIGYAFFEEQDPSLFEKKFNAYYKAFSPIAYRSAFNILKDHDMAGHIVGLLFTQLWTSKNKDKFKFDTTKSHSGYIHYCAMNKSKLELRRIRGEKLVFEASMITEDADENYAEKIFYNNGNTAVPEKRRMNQGKMYDEVDLDTVIFDKVHGRGVVTGSTDDELVVEFDKTPNLNKKNQSNQTTVVIGEPDIDGFDDDDVTPQGLTDQEVDSRFNAEIITKFDEHTGDERIIKISKENISICTDMGDGGIHLKSIDYIPDTMSIRRSMTIDDGNSDFIAFDERSELLFDKVMGEFESYYDKIKEILRNYQDQGLLYDAIIEKINYSDLAAKYNLETPGAVKTRVFRAKKRLHDMMQSEQIIAKLKKGDRYTGELSYYDEKARLLYKTNYVNGLLHGRFYAFHLNNCSTLRVDTEFNGGVLAKINPNSTSPSYKEYDTDNKIIISGTFEDNRENGIFQYWENNIIKHRVDWCMGEAGIIYDYKDGIKVDCKFMTDDIHPIQLMKFKSVLHGRKRSAAARV